MKESSILELKSRSPGVCVSSDGLVILLENIEEIFWRGVYRRVLIERGTHTDRTEEQAYLDHSIAKFGVFVIPLNPGN